MTAKPLKEFFVFLQQAVKIYALNASACSFQTTTRSRRYNDSRFVVGLLQLSCDNAGNPLMGILQIYDKKRRVLILFVYDIFLC